MGSVNYLEELLVALSDGVWEHGQGIKITSLDNPGWTIDLCLSGTQYSEIVEEPRLVERSDDDWFHIKTEERDFAKFLEINCGPRNLEECLGLLRTILERERA